MLNGKKSKSNYTHSIEQHQGQNFLVIIDDDIGGMSVTNNIENVVNEIIEIERLPKSYIFDLIVYKDSDEYWCSWDHITESFIPGILEKTMTEAMDKLLAKLKK